MEGDARRLTTEELLAHAGWVQALARRLVHDQATADDLVQETWLAALEQRWRGSGPSRAWLATVLRNAAHRRARGDASRGRRERQSAGDEALPSTGELLARVEQQRTLVDAVRALEDPYGRTVLLRYHEGLSSAEIARREGVPQATVRSRLKRALEQLRTRLDDRHEGGRATWVRALAPLARLAERDATLVGASVASGVGAGVLGGASLAVAALVVLLVGVLALRDGLPDPETVSSAVEPLAGEARPGDAAGGLERVHVGSPVRSADSTASPAGLAAATGTPAVPPSAPGWWLVGHVRGVDVSDPDPVRVHVRASGSDEEATLERLVAPGALELDLSELFAHESLLCETLEVRFDHPRRVGVPLRFSPSRAERQAGFRPGGSVRFPFDVTLEPPRAVLHGTVDAPPGTRVTVGAVWFDGADDERGSMLATDGTLQEVACGADGRYVLPVDRLGRQRVIAFDQGENAARSVPRPGWVELDVRPGEQAVAPIRLADLGVEVAGTVRFTGPPPCERMQLVLMRSAGAGPLESPLVWAREGYGYMVRFGVVDGGGHFRLDGLDPGEYELAFREFLAGPEIEPLHAIYGLARRSIRVTAPDPSVTVDLGRYVFLEVWGAGSPLVGATVCLGSNPAGSPDTGTTARAPRASRLRGYVWTPASGRAVLALADADAGYQEVLIEKPGFTSSRLLPDELRSGEWMRVELEPDPLAASIVLHVEGDPERRVEQFRTFIERLDAVVPGESAVERVVKRVGDELRLVGLDAGRYALRLVPTSRGFHQFDAWIQPETLELDLLAGGNTAALQLREGGRVRIVDAAADGRTTATTFRVFDAGGNELRLEATRRLGEGGLETSIGGLSRGPHPEPLELFPTLPPGAYELEIDEEGRAIERHPVMLEPGRSTIVTVE